MQMDWEMVSGVSLKETAVSVYMLVMKGCLGVPTLVVDGGALPDGLLGYSATIAMEGCKRCYLGERMAPWCLGYTQHIDVCQAIEITVRVVVIIHTHTHTRT